jgi:hypothetical protein
VNRGTYSASCLALALSAAATACDGAFHVQGTVYRSVASTSAGVGGLFIEDSRPANPELEPIQGAKVQFVYTSLNPDSIKPGDPWQANLTTDVAGNFEADVACSPWLKRGFLRVRADGYGEVSGYVPRDARKATSVIVVLVPSTRAAG